MKKILLYITIIVTTLVAADRVIYYFFSKYVFSRTLSGDTGGAINYSLQKKKNVGFIILGSSRAKFLIDPALLTAVDNGKGYNAGKSGFGGIVYNNMLLHLILNKNAVPETIILQIDPNYYFKWGAEDFTYELLPLYPFINDSKELKDFISTHSNYAEKFKLFFHLYRYNGKFAGVFYNYFKRRSFKANTGFESLTGRIDTATFNITEPLKKEPTYSTVKIDLLSDFVSTCNARHIKLLVVFPPTYKNSYFLKQASDTIAHLLNKDGPVTIYDFSDIEKTPALQSADLWKDDSHLNNKGAIIFSKLLNDSISLKLKR